MALTAAQKKAIIVATTRQSIQRTISPAAIQRLQQQYTDSESIAPPLDRLPFLDEQCIYRQSLALKARKHMIPHNGDGLLRIEDYDSGTNKIAVHILVESLPVIWQGTPYGHLDGLKKCVIFVAISKTNARPRLPPDPTVRLPELTIQEGEVFWVAGVSGNGEHFVAKSQDKLVGAADAVGPEKKWEESKWGLVEIKECALAVLDVKDGAWIMCDAVREN
ncbi:hypothetical protein M409DRAFT_24561 [Zasmidium cellare ATCC 36951]|uniref:Uncharacterized protein n=1 Tax=Zasmidium cellare ATCC 36951 TaxID=1080233 RepID=A0A6A6CDK3_ZASCE|nr:uncharacterized protein M409DRAFT_24561 [Zasmidium cellare ATCC 36951]KAF2165175.1 hypothetical protein M409DRAFT_24561 [Zasmidium cellare ATCC 36951]